MSALAAPSFLRMSGVVDSHPTGQLLIAMHFFTHRYPDILRGSRHVSKVPKGDVALATSELSAQGSGAPSAVGHLVHERSKSNDDFGCSLTVASDTIERLPDSFQIWRFSAQPV